MVKNSLYPRLYYELLFAGSSLMLGMGLSGAFLPILSWELDPTGLLVGFVTSAWFLARIFTELPSGLLSDMLGRRRLALFGLTVSLVGTLMCASSHFIHQLILGRALWGLGAAFFFTNNTALIFDMFEPSVRGKALGTLQAIEFLGSLVGTPLGAVSATFFGYYSVFYVASLMTLLSFFVAFLSKGLKQATSSQRERHTSISICEALKGLRSWALLVACLAIMTRMLVTHGVMLTVFQLYLNQVLSYDVALIGLIMGVRTAGFCAATFLSGRLTDRLGLRPVITVGLLVEGICLCLYTMTNSLTYVIVVGLLEGFGGGAIWLTLSILLSRAVPPRMRGSAVGLFRTFMALGGILGPVIFMFVYDSIGRSVPFLAGAALLMTNLPLVVSVRKRHMLEVTSP